MKLSNKAIVAIIGLISISASVIMTSSPGGLFALILLLPIIEWIDN